MNRWNFCPESCLMDNFLINSRKQNSILVSASSSLLSFILPLGAVLSHPLGRASPPRSISPPSGPLLCKVHQDRNGSFRRLDRRQGLPFATRLGSCRWWPRIVLWWWRNAIEQVECFPAPFFESIPSWLPPLSREGPVGWRRFCSIRARPRGQESLINFQKPLLILGTVQLRASMEARDFVFRVNGNSSRLMKNLTCILPELGKRYNIMRKNFKYISKFD